MSLRDPGWVGVERHGFVQGPGKHVSHLPFPKVRWR